MIRGIIGQDYDDDGYAASDGASLLNDVEAFIARFVAYPSDAALVAATLWAAHAHLVNHADSTPRLAHLSPEPGSGKTRALEVLESLVPRPVHAVNVTPAYLFRKVGDPEGSVTILFDEVDTIFGPKAKDNEDVRGLLNAGHRKGATAGRCVVRGRTIETEELPAYAAVALAGLGDLPDTVMSRSIVIRMRRRAPGEHVEPWRRRVHEPEGRKLRDRLEAWAATVAEELEDAWPKMPEGVTDRAADVWEPLLAIADAAGGDWPERVRVAAVALVTASAERPATLGIRLLADLRRVFLRRDVDGVTVTPAEYERHVFTQTIIDHLCALSESPWADLRGKPIDANRLSRMLKDYGVRSKTVRVGEDVGRGYSSEDLHDPWGRYLPAEAGTDGDAGDATPSPDNAVTPATPATPATGWDTSTHDAWLPFVAPVAAVTPVVSDGGRDDAGENPPWVDSAPPDDAAEWLTTALFDVVDVEDETTYDMWDDLLAGPCGRCQDRHPNRYGENADPLCASCRAAVTAGHK